MYLMRKQGLSLHEALTTVRSARRCCTPNEGFLRQLAEYESFVTGTAGGSERQGQKKVEGSVSGLEPHLLHTEERS